MPHLYKLKNTDKIINVVKTFPQASFVFHAGKSYYNDKAPMSGAYSSRILGVPAGHISLYEQDVDRSGTLNFASASSSATTGQAHDPFAYSVAQGLDPTLFYEGPNPHYATFLVKNGTRINFRSVSTAEYNAKNIGDVIYSYQPLSSSLQKYYYSASFAKYVKSDDGTTTGTPVTGSVTYLYALKNTLNYYQILNTNYAFSSSARNLGASGSQPGAIDVGLLSIPSIFYGDTISKGTVDLRFYVTGTLVGRIQDSNQNGDLIQTGPRNSVGSGSTAGVILYNEGFIVLTGSWDLSSGSHVESYGTNRNYPAWVNFAQTISASAPHALSSSCLLNYSGSQKIPTQMYFVTAPKNQLNHSNNVTYRDYTTPLAMAESSVAYKQNFNANIKNTVSSAYADPTGSFAKITYITTVGLYDNDKNLIGIAKVAKPVKKLEERELTFKLKLDY